MPQLQAKAKELEPQSTDAMINLAKTLTYGLGGKDLKHE